MTDENGTPEKKQFIPGRWRDKKQASEAGKKGVIARKELKMRRMAAVETARQVLEAEIKLSPSMMANAKAMGFKNVNKLTNLQILMLSVLSEAIKTGDAKRMESLISAAGWNFNSSQEAIEITRRTTESSSGAPSGAVSPDAELVLSAVLNSGRKVDRRSPAQLRADKAKQEEHQFDKEEKQSLNEVVFSGLG